MINKYYSVKKIIFPNKKINIFVLFVLFFGVMAGALFANFIGLNDKKLVIDKIQLFIENINSNSLNNIIILKNSLSINYIYVFMIWFLGMTIIGLLFNICLLFIKGFVFGFSIASFIITYGYKGILLSILYLLFGQLLNIIIIIILSIYGIMFAFKLIKLIFKNDNNHLMTKFLKNYLIILAFVVVTTIISSLSEAFLLPALIKLIIKLYI